MKKNSLIDARAGHCAIGAFNVNTYDEMIALAEAATERNLPVILMASMSSARFMGARHFAGLVRLLNDGYPIDIRSHLDHCTDPKLLLECVDAGFDSVMFDGSPLPFEENASITAELAKASHARGVFIEGELGVIAGEEGPVKSKYSRFTDPDAAERFVALTGIDALAVSIGNAHGFYKGKPELRFDLLEEISRRCALPLVLHGGTGIPDEDIQRAIAMGIAKVNVGTEIRNSYVMAIHRYAEENPKGDVRAFVEYLRSAVGRAAARYMDNFCCARKAGI